MDEKNINDFITGTLQGEIDKVKKVRKNLVLLLIVVEHLKAIKDQYGAEVSDDILNLIEARLKQHLRATDVVVRIDKITFGVLVTNVAKLDYTVIIVRKIMDLFIHPFVIKDHQILVTIKIGVGNFPIHGHTGEALFKYAENSLK